MRLSDFIRQNRPAIIEEWQGFARTLRSSAQMTDLQLADHIDDILTFIANDIETAQTVAEQFDKSQGRQEEQNPGVDTAAETHAAERHNDGFDIVELVSEYRALRASVSKLWAQVHPVMMEEDIDDLGRFNEAIDQALAESVVRFTKNIGQAKDLLLGVLGHAIRSPVSAIQMVADLVPRAGPVNHEQSRLLQQIKLSTDRVQHIVSDLLDLAKSNAGQGLPLKKARCSLTRLCEQIVEEMRLRHAGREILVILPGNVEGHWDETRLGQLLGNLLANAVQYGAPDKPIVVMVTDNGNDIVMDVTNDGDPIPAAHQERIFKSFSRGQSIGSDREVPTSNLGLGLFISREIARAHGGSISVVSSRAEGTTFSVHLPKWGTGDKPGAKSALEQPQGAIVQ